MTTFVLIVFSSFFCFCSTIDISHVGNNQGYGGNNKQIPYDEMILQQVLKGQGDLQTKFAVIDKRETEQETMYKHILETIGQLLSRIGSLEQKETQSENELQQTQRVIGQLLNRISSFEKKEIESENALQQMQRTIDKLEANIQAKHIDTSTGQIHVTNSQNMNRIDQLEANVSVISNWKAEKNSMFDHIQETMVVLQNTTDKCLQRNAVLEHRISQIGNSSDSNNVIQKIQMNQGVMQSKLDNMENKTSDAENNHRLLQERVHQLEIAKGHVVFTATNTADFSVGVGHILQFRTMKTNIGNGYNMHTSVFKAPVSGMYAFYFMIRVQNGYICWINLVKNGQTIMTAWGRDDGNSPNFGFFRLDAGESVWLERGSYRGSCSIDELSSFSGFLFYSLP